MLCLHPVVKTSSRGERGRREGISGRRKPHVAGSFLSPEILCCALDGDFRKRVETEQPISLVSSRAGQNQPDGKQLPPNHPRAHLSPLAPSLIATSSVTGVSACLSS